MDGMSIGILVATEVEDGEAYHIKFCIVDVEYGSFDSAESYVEVFPNPSVSTIHIQNRSSEQIQRIYLLENQGRTG